MRTQLGAAKRCGHPTRVGERPTQHGKLADTRCRCQYTAFRWDNHADVGTRVGPSSLYFLLTSRGALHRARLRPARAPPRGVSARPRPTRRASAAVWFLLVLSSSSSSLSMLGEGALRSFRLAPLSASRRVCLLLPPAASPLFPPSRGCVPPCCAALHAHAVCSHANHVQVPVVDHLVQLQALHVARAVQHLRAWRPRASAAVEQPADGCRKLPACRLARRDAPWRCGRAG